MNNYTYNGYNEEELLKMIDFINFTSDGYPTSNCLGKGSLNNIFLKKLNIQKINQIYKGNYLALFNEYYNLIRNLVKTNEIYGIIFYNENIYEFSRVLNKNTFLDDGNSFLWDDIIKLFDKILLDINSCIRYNFGAIDKVGFETAIWNFTIDGTLFDLDPPKILKINEDTSFTRVDDINHVKRTLYRSFDEIGMKANLLVTFMLGQKHNSFIVKNQPDNYIEILIDKIIKSFTNDNVYKTFINCLENGLSKNENFIDHPIDILRREIMIKENGKKKKFIFVAGTSESGKSGGINYLKGKYSIIQHIKIRDVFPKVYQDTFSSLSFEEWQDFEEKKDLNNFWRLFVNKVYEIIEDGKDVIILDTMYGVDGMIELYNILGDNVSLLYIDAPFEERVMREYNRLRQDSTNSTRKADLSITVDDIIERTIKKDKKKNIRGASLLPNLSYCKDGKSITVDEFGERFTFIMNNNGTIEEFYRDLDNYLEEHIFKNNSYIKKLKKD